MHRSRPQIRSRGRATKAVVGGLLAAIALLAMPPLANANFVYWANTGAGNSIGRAKINGTGFNNAFIGSLNNVHGVAVDSKFIYWTQGSGATSTIGRANLDGSSPNPNFIPNSGALNFAPAAPQSAIAVTASAIYWTNSTTVGRANIDGSSPASPIVNPGGDPLCGVAADPNFVYWLDSGLGQSIGRAGPDGSSPTFNFISGATGNCGVAVDPSFIYWGSSSKSVGRAPIGGGSPNNDFIPNAAPAGATVCGVAVNSQYVFWGNSGPSDFIGRANTSGSSPNPSLIAGATDPCLPAAAPSNKITVNSIKKKKSKGTASISAKVPGPGQVTLNQTSTPPDVNATAAAVKQIGLTISQASSFSLAVKPVGKTAKKLNKQIKKQLKKKRKAKATAKVTTYIHFIPAGVAGVPNTLQVNVTLVKQAKKK
jgi:virginiamycin B lyase